MLAASANGQPEKLNSQSSTAATVHPSPVRATSRFFGLKSPCTSRATRSTARRSGASAVQSSTQARRSAGERRASGTRRMQAAANAGSCSDQARTFSCSSAKSPGWSKDTSPMLRAVRATTSPSCSRSSWGSSSTSLNTAASTYSRAMRCVVDQEHARRRHRRPCHDGGLDARIGAADTDDDGAGAERHQAGGVRVPAGQFGDRRDGRPEPPRHLLELPPVHAAGA